MRFDRHRGPVTCARMIAGVDTEGPIIVSGAYDGAVAVSDVKAQTMDLLGYHDHLVNRVAVASAGQMVASASSDYTVRIWNPRERCLTATLRGHADDVEDFAFVDETTGVSASRDKRVIVWDLPSGSIRSVLSGHEKDVLSVACAEGLIVTSGDDMTLRVWDLETGRAVRIWGPFENETDSCAVDLTRGRALLGCDDGVMRIFDLVAGNLVAEVRAHCSGIKNIAVCPSSGDILTAAYDRRYIVWDADDLTASLELESMASVWERSLSWTPNGRQIVGGTFDGTVVGWEADTGHKSFEIGSREGNACLDDVGVIGGLAVTVADDGEVRTAELSVSKARWREAFVPRDERVLSNAVATEPSTQRVLTGSHDGILRGFSCRPRDVLEHRFSSRLGEGPINCIRLLDEVGGGDAFVACYSGTVVRASPTGEVVARLTVHDGAVKSLRLLPTLGVGVSCCADGTVASWDLESGRHVSTYPGHTAIVNDVDVNQAGDRLVTVGRDFLLNVYELSEGKLLSSIRIGQRSPKSVCFVGEAMVMIGDYWGYLVRVSLGDMVIMRRRVAENGLSAITCRSDGRVVATSYDGSLLLIDPAGLDVIQRLRAMRQRDPGHLLMAREMPLRGGGPIRSGRTIGCSGARTW